MNSRYLIAVLASHAIFVSFGCITTAHNQFDHATTWYEYDFKRGGPVIVGMIYRFDGDDVRVTMFGSSLDDGELHEDLGYTMRIMKKSADGYAVFAGSGSQGRLDFDGKDLILRWDEEDPRMPERRLTSVPPDFKYLRARWEAETGMTLEEFLKDD